MRLERNNMDGFKICSRCKKEKPMSEYYSTSPSRCKSCVKETSAIFRQNLSGESKIKYMETRKRIRQRYKTDFNKWLKQIYRAMRKRNIDKFNSELPFTEPEFEKWLEDNYGEKAKTMFKTYVDSDCDKYLKPSIDRIDDYKGYSFDNMQLLTWAENNEKGRQGRKNKESCSRIAREVYAIEVTQYDLSGQVVNVFQSVRDVERITGYSSTSIGRACRRTEKNIRCVSHGFIWKYTGTPKIRR